MKITNIRIRQIQGVMTYPGTLMEERQRYPWDIYPEYKDKGVPQDWGTPLGNDRYRVTHYWVQVDTDEGVSGVYGPAYSAGSRFFIDTQIKPLLLGKDPLATEYLWDLMYRNAIHGRKGDNMIAISQVDIALWDLKGKWLGQPVYRLLGGPTRDRIPAYASAVGYSLDPEKVRMRVKEYTGQGYTGMKWFFREGPGDGVKGIKKNIELMKTLREAAGHDVEIMVDVWNSWDVPYTLKMAELFYEYEPSWIEEPVMPDLIDSYVYLRQKSPIPIAGGEHEYTRWGCKTLMDAGAMDIYQVDPTWGGGITEFMKICALATSYDVPIIPHGGVVPVCANISFALNLETTPWIEYQNVLNESKQFFYKDALKPVNGFISPPTKPGIGLDIDQNKVESEKDVSFR